MNASRPRSMNTALADAFAPKSLRSTFAAHGLPFILMGVFFLIMMFCLTAGVGIYRDISASHARAGELRMQSGLMTGIVRSCDMADAATVGAGPEGEALVLVTQLASGTYETRLYLYEGSIVEEYAIAGRPFNPENAVALAESQTFACSIDGNLVRITTDDGEFCVALRSVQGGGGA